MSELVVNFVYMFLLVKDEKNPVVLIPNGGSEHEHAARLALSPIGPRHDLRRADVRFWMSETADGANRGPIPGGPVSFPDPALLLDLNDMPTSKASPGKVRSTFFGGSACPVELNARVFLPPGAFVALGTKDGPSAAIRWIIDGDTPRRRFLSDQMQFHCPIDPTRHYWVTIGAGAPIKLAADPDGSITTSVVNDDVHQNVPLKKVGGFDVLDEFETFYSLLDDAAGRPLPKRRTPPPEWGSGPLRPICGGSTINA